MNIDFTHYHGVHQGGTKDYNLYLLSNKALGSKSSLLIKRWGKTGTTGQCKVEVVPGTGEGSLSAALRDREKNGYDMRHQSTSANNISIESALSLLPPTHARSVTNAQLAVLDPASFSPSDRSPFDPLAAQRSVEIEKAKKAAAMSEQEEIDAILKANPNFGMF